MKFQHEFKMKLNTKKGAIQLADAPAVVFIVGFVFLMMATLAYISSEYRSGLGTSSASVTNESITQTALAANSSLNGVDNCGTSGFSVTNVNNGSWAIITSGNYTATAYGYIVNTTSTFSVSSWNVTYTYDHGGTACNVTTDLEEELSDNTSIAGIVLTISLVGIILSVLIGIFVASRRRGM